MINVFPYKVSDINAIAVSGGVDSVVFLDFLSRGNKNIKIVHFNHGTQHGKKAEEFVVSLSNKYSLELILGDANNKAKPRKESWEEFWRNERYKFFHSLELTIATGQHLEDVAETWLFGAIHGQPKLMPFANRNVIRPFLTTKKESILRWADKNKISHIEDPSNADPKYARNRIRHNIMPEVLKVNPGLSKVILKKMIKKAEEIGEPCYEN